MAGAAQQVLHNRCLTAGAGPPTQQKQGTMAVAASTTAAAGLEHWCSGNEFPTNILDCANDASLWNQTLELDLGGIGTSIQWAITWH